MVRRTGGVTVVILTALDLEYLALRRHLVDPRLVRHDAGTLFEVGSLTNTSVQVAIAVTGPGNLAAAVLAERAISRFSPRALFFVGVAGALSEELDLGDVVVATKVYGYQGGKEDDRGFHARPAAWDAPHELEQLARHLARTDQWRAWLPHRADRSGSATVHFKPVAAGEVVLNSRETPLAEQLRHHYNDAAAIEMESAGTARAGHLNRALPALTIRGISDKADGRKRDADSAGLQPRAMAPAAAFASALAALLASSEDETRPPDPARPSYTQHVIGNGGITAASLTGDVHLHPGPSA